MSSLLATKIARRRSIAFVSLLAATLVMMAFSSLPATHEFQGAVSFVLRPIQGALNDVAKGVSGVVGAFTEIERLAAENLRLAEAEHQNEVLTGLLQLQNGFTYKSAAATVIARESSEFRRFVTISKGTDDGMVEGGALAGRVVEVGPNYSKVILITDQTSTVIGQLQTSGASGAVVGQLEGALLMTNIDSTETIELGEEVLTAGIELGGGVRSPYPKGLLIGQVIDVRRDANSVVQTAYLAPAANLDKIEYVLVVLNYEGGLPAGGDAPVDCSKTGPGGVIPGGEQPCIEATPSPRPSKATSSAAPNVAPSVRPSP